MRLPEITLDDRNFQDLVNEARLRISQRCPEWSEHNVSDPGITLIELFAWMTEATHLPAESDPREAARHAPGAARHPDRSAERCDDGSALLARCPGDRTGAAPGGETEVGTVRTASEEAIVFQTTRDFVIPPARPIAYAVKRDERRQGHRCRRWRSTTQGRRPARLQLAAEGG